MRDALKGILVGILVLVVLATIAGRAGWMVVSVPRPEGVGAWTLSRASGLLAYVVLSLDVIAGLLVSTRLGDRFVTRGRLVDLHGWLSPLALALVLAHGGVLLADNYVRFDAIDVFVPFASSRWPAGVGVGVLGGYLALVVHVSFGLRKRIGTAMWRRLHYLSFLAFTLASIHAIAVGTDRSSAWFASIYTTMLFVVGALVAVRITAASSRSRS